MELSNRFAEPQIALLFVNAVKQIVNEWLALTVWTSSQVLVENWVRIIAYWQSTQ